MLCFVCFVVVHFAYVIIEKPRSGFPGCGFVLIYFHSESCPKIADCHLKMGPRQGVQRHPFSCFFSKEKIERKARPFAKIQKNKSA